MTFQLRKPNATDVPILGKIAYNAFCGIADAHCFPHDFGSEEMAQGLIGAFTSHPSVYGVVAEENGQPIGSNFLDERDTIVAVGPITVSPAAQSKGVGRALMKAVVERGDSAAGIRLVQDAFNRTSLSLYASLGFDVKEPLALISGKPKSAPPAGRELRPLTEADLAGCGALCEKVHGFSRVNELGDSMKMFGPSFGAFKSGRPIAYMATPTFWFLNHAVGESEQDLRDVILAAGAANTAPLMFLLPTRQTNLFRWCLSEGFKVVKPMTLMAMGRYQEPKGAFITSVGY